MSQDHESVTAGMLYEISRPTLVDEMAAIRERAVAGVPPPTREMLLQTFLPGGAS